MSRCAANDEHISFVLSNLRKHGALEEGFPPPPPRERATSCQSGARRRAVLDEGDAAVAAAAAGVNGFDLEEGERDSDRFVAAARRDAPPLRLKPRRGCCLATVATWGVFGTVLLVVAVESHARAGASLFSADETATLERRLARDATIQDELRFGIWDSRRSITPLQLQVAISVALGVRAEDDDVRVLADENSFFKIEIFHATIEEAEYVASDAFFAKLNAHLAHYDGNAVLSHPPKLQKRARVESFDKKNDTR